MTSKPRRRARRAGDGRDQASTLTLSISGLKTRKRSLTPSARTTYLAPDLSRRVAVGSCSHLAEGPAEEAKLGCRGPVVRRRFPDQAQVQRPLSASISRLLQAHSRRVEPAFRSHPSWSRPPSVSGAARRWLLPAEATPRRGPRSEWPGPMHTLATGGPVAVKSPLSRETSHFSSRRSVIVVATVVSEEADRQVPRRRTSAPTGSLTASIVQGHPSRTAGRETSGSDGRAGSMFAVAARRATWAPPIGMDCHRGRSSA